jgi:hypothetical protein
MEQAVLERKRFHLPWATTTKCKFADYFRRWPYINGFTRSQDNASNSPFLRLPAELRNEIYHLVYDKAVIVITSPSTKQVMTTATPLSQVSRQLRSEVTGKAREAVIILRQGLHINSVLRVLDLRHNEDSRAARPKVLRYRDIVCAYGIQDPLRFRINHPVDLLNKHVDGLVGRDLEGTELVRVFFMRPRTERATLKGLSYAFVKPGLVEDLFYG